MNEADNMSREFPMRPSSDEAIENRRSRRREELGEYSRANNEFRSV